MKGSRRPRWLRAPSPAMIVALVALVFAMSGTSLAASQLLNGDKVIKKGTLSGNRLRDNTVTGSKIKVGTLAKVPSAAAADTATTATHAASADTATTASHAASADALAAGAVGTGQFGSIPVARVKISNPGALSLTSDASHTLSYGAEEFDVGDLHSAAQPTRLTAPVSGKYLVLACCAWGTVQSEARTVMAITKNGTAKVAEDQMPIDASWPEQTIATVCQLQAGDYVEVSVYQDTGFTAILLDAAGTNWFSMNWLAP
jgi:hypothetical protein